MHENSDRKLIELRLARAYIDLLCALDGDRQAQISISRTDDHEIRIIVRPPTDAGDDPLFWMELFDHGTRASINSYACCDLADGAEVFEEFHSEAKLSEAERRPAETRRES